MSAAETRVVYDFGEFRLDPTQRQLFAKTDDQPVTLTSRAFDVLLYLVAHPGELVSRDDLMLSVWPHAIVEENNLSQCIAAIRRALGERAGEHKYVVTIPGRGFRFVAQVTQAAASSAAQILPMPQIATNVARPWKLSRTVGLLATALVIVLACSAYLVWPQRSSKSAAQTLAVLPFKAVAPTDSNPSLQYGMAQTLIQRLQVLDGITVQPFSSVARYGNPEQDPLLAARELAAKSVLDGTIQRDGNRLRVTARLVNVEDGRELWSENFHEDFTGIFQVQDAIAAQVAEALAIRLTRQAQQRLSRRYTDDAEAYQLYVNGWFQRSRTGEEGYLRSIDFFEQAIARDPHYPQPYIGLADSYAMLAIFGAQAPDVAFPRALAAVTKALELDDEMGEAHASLAHIKLQYQHDSRGAKREYLRAVSLAPNYALAHMLYGLFEAQNGELEAGLARLHHAQKLEPLFLGTSANIGMLYYYSGRYDEAIEQLRGVLEADPSMDHARSFLGRAYLRKGEYAAAIDEFKRRKSLSIGSYADLASAYALAGNNADALTELDRVMTVARQRYVPAYDIATIHASLGNTDQVFEWLDHAFTEHAQFGFFSIDPAFDKLRGDPRMGRLLARVRAQADGAASL